MNILSWILFVVLGTVFVVIIIYTSAKMRSTQLAKLAKHFGLVYESGLGNWKWLLEKRKQYQRNTLSGIYNGHKVLIFDAFERYEGFTFWNRFAWSESTTKKCTIVNIDGHEEKLFYLGISGAFGYGLPSVGRIRAKIMEMISEPK